MSDEVQTVLERFALIGEGMKGVVQRIEQLEQERDDATAEEKDVTFDDKIEYLETLLKDRHLELIRRQRAHAEIISEMQRTEAYLGELFKAAKAITATISDKVLKE